MHNLQLLNYGCSQVFQATEQEGPGSVAYDTPSPKLLSFLQKHYGESCPYKGTAWCRPLPVALRCPTLSAVCFKEGFSLQTFRHRRVLLSLSASMSCRAW